MAIGAGIFIGIPPLVGGLDVYWQKTVAALHPATITNTVAVGATTMSGTEKFRVEGAAAFGTGPYAPTGDIRLPDLGKINFTDGAGAADITGLWKSAGDNVSIGGANPTRPAGVLIDPTTNIHLRIGGADRLLVQNTLITASVPIAVGTAPYAPTGDIRLPDLGAINFYGTGPADISGMYKTAGDLLYIGGANPTRPANIAIDPTTSTIINVAGVQKLTVATAAVTAIVPVVLPSYAKAALPAVTAASMIYVTDEAGGAVPCFADGANFRRCTDRAIVS